MKNKNTHRTYEDEDNIYVWVKSQKGYRQIYFATSFRTGWHFYSYKDAASFWDEQIGGPRLVAYGDSI